MGSPIRTDVCQHKPAVWVACLGCYNAGRLYGVWCDAIDAPTTMVDFIDDMARIGAVPPSSHHSMESHEELWVFDHEHYYGTLVGECSPAEAKAVAEMIDDLSDVEREALGLYLADQHSVLTDELVERWRDSYHGLWESEKDYAMSYAEDLGWKSNPAWPAYCIDWEYATRELFTGDVYSDRSRIHPGWVHVYSRH